MAGSILFDKRRKKWYALVTQVVNGKRRYWSKYGDNKTHAKKQLDVLRDEIKEEIRLESASDLEGETVKTFEQLALNFEANRMKPAKHVGGKKISGRRSMSGPQAWLKSLQKHFGEYELSSISATEIENYKLKLADTPTRQGDGVRSIAAINRELEFLRTMMIYAVKNGWLTRDPFENVQTKLIDKSLETHRERLLGFGEELALLNACFRPDARNSEAGNPRLKAIIICAVDTGLRRNELFTLLWSDLDFTHKVIRVREINTKGNRSREIPMTARVFELLIDSKGNPDDFVFDGVKSVDRSFNTACRLAKIEDLHFHDMRHCFITRSILAGIPVALVTKASGHMSSEWQRYVNVDPRSLRSLLAPVGDQAVDEVKAYAATVLKGLRAALHYDEIEALLK